MKGNGWRITRVHGEVSDSGSNHNTEYATPKTASDFPVRFRLSDDDGVVYFTGRATVELCEDGESIFAPLYEYGILYGCTTLETFENGKWEHV